VGFVYLWVFFDLCLVLNVVGVEGGCRDGGGQVGVVVWGAVVWVVCCVGGGRVFLVVGL